MTKADRGRFLIFLIQLLRRFWGQPQDLRWVGPGLLSEYVGVVFSKNRACQLDALLRSLRQRVPACRQVHVLWRAGSDQHRQSYQKIQDLHPGCHWVEQNEFSSDLRNILSCLRQDAVMFCTDDGIFFEPAPALLKPDWGQTAGISLRLGRNSSYCHPANETYPAPGFQKIGNLLAWRWQKAKGDFRVTYSLDAHIYPRKRLMEIMARFHFQNPNQLEDRLNRFGVQDAPDWMLCPEKSCYVSLPINRVNSEFLNRAGLEHPVSEQDLLEKFLSGQRLDIDRIVTSQPVGPHQEYPLAWTN